MAPGLPPPASREQRRSRGKRDLLIATGVFLVIAGFFAYSAYRTIGGAINSRRQFHQSKKPVQIPLPEYEPFFGESALGTGFHFDWGGRRFIACSLHQFEGGKPNEMIVVQLDDNVRVGKRVYADNDVQVLDYQSLELDKIPPLDYRQDFTVSLGDPVVLYHNADRTVGHVSHLPDKEGIAHFRTSDSFAASGCSGAPVVSGLTGTVIGVALTANHPDRARRVGFQVLKLPDSLRAKESGSTAESGPLR